MPIFDATPLDTDPEGCDRLTYILSTISWTLDAHSVTPSRGSFNLVKGPPLESERAFSFNNMLGSKAVLDASVITSMAADECSR